MRIRILLPVMLCCALFNPSALAIEVSGDVWGVWCPDDNPHEVVGDLRIPQDSTLTIEPGCYIDFQDWYMLMVDTNATLQAIGSETDSIYFTCDTLSNPDRWYGIRLYSADDSCKISYCLIEYGKAEGEWPEDSGGGIYCGNSNPTISHCTIRFNSCRSGGGYLAFTSVQP